MAHKTTLTNQISPDPHVSFFIVQASSSHPPLAFFEAQKIGNSNDILFYFGKMQNLNYTIICFDYGDIT
uniref:Uncharacterized protein n=1 Tax=Brassica oleracea TaxID=3712 RepID=A0A3P6H5I5_BRAOL|nr:unnamed protein product [Brassica oleracea]